MVLERKKIQTLFLVGFVIFTLSITTPISQRLKNNQSVFSVAGYGSNHTQNDEFLVVQDGIAYLLSTKHIAIYNISNPVNTNLISYTEVDFGGELPANLYVENKMVYVSDMDTNLYRIDCSNPYNIIQKSSFSFDEIIHDIVVLGENLYIIHETTMTIYDISGVQPEVIGTVECPCSDIVYLKYLAVHKNFAYAIDSEYDFRIINVTDISSPIYSNSSGQYWARQITHCGDILLAMDPNYGFRVINLSSPGEIRIECYFDGLYTNSHKNDLFYYENVVYVACDDELILYNVTNYNNISTITIFQPLNYENQYFGSIYVENDYVFLYNWRESPLYIIDVSDPQNPVHVYPEINTGLPLPIISIVCGLVGIFILRTIIRKRRTIT